MDRLIEEAAALHALDLLEGEERERFAARMLADPALRQWVEEAREALHNSMRLDVGDGPSPAVLAAARARVSGTWAKVEAAPVGAASRWSWIWASAAALLLLVNGYLLWTGGERSGSASELTVDVSTASTAGGPRVGLAAQEAALRATLRRVEAELAAKELELAQRVAREQALQADVSEVNAENVRWRESYTRLAARLMPFFDGRKGLSRFTVIEMVDARLPSDEAPRRPFAELANQFLMGTSGIGRNDPAAFIGPQADGVGWAAGATEAAGIGLAPISLSDVGQNVLSGLDGTPGRGEAVLFGGDATGFTVWRDDEQKGFLDLYNLPDPGAGREAVLWARSSDLEPYVYIGVIPPLEGGTGSLFYSVDKPDFAPTEILITAELQEGAGATPDTDGVLLRGP